MGVHACRVTPLITTSDEWAVGFLIPDTWQLLLGGAGVHACIPACFYSWASAPAV